MTEFPPELEPPEIMPDPDSKEFGEWIIRMAWWQGYLDDNQFMSYIWLKENEEKT